ncbi:MAG TPA: PilN domain-containing protein [Thiopseudomonas sp.]|nr:PilN domain-containing protein [Thiopseudomonas sp.]
MVRINLLPWREQLREERKQRFFIILAGVCILAVTVIFLADQYLKAKVTQQNARNAYILQENTVLDSRIQEISELKTRRQQLVERMKIIQDLQANRPIAARVFDQLVRTLPDGVYFTDLKMQGQSIFIEGAAESNNLISSLMRNQDASDWLTAPSLIEVKAVSADKLEQASTFKLTVLQTVPKDSDQPGVKP